MKKPHYSLLVCIGCALVLFCTSGLAINAFTVYQPYILRQDGFGNTRSSMLIMIRNLMSLLSMFLTGTYYARLGYRRGLCLAGLLSALSLLLLGSSHSYPAYCLCFALMGIAYGLGTMIPITILLGRWFIGRRTVAIGACSAVTGFSTLGIPFLLTRLIETRGLSFAFRTEALAVALLILTAFLCIRDTPEECGTHPYGQAEANPKVKGSAQRPDRRLCGRSWILLAPMLLTLGAMTSVAYSHLSVLMMADGFDADLIAIGVTLSGIALTGGKLLYSALCERTSVYLGNRVFGCLTLIGLTLCILNGGSSIVMCAGLFLYSGGLAFTTVGLAAWCGELCSEQQYPQTVRRFQIGYAAGSLLFSPLPGLLTDRFHGSYRPAYLFFLACTLFVLLSIQYLLRRQRNG